ncbi:MAG: PBS lyase [Proteobacteria bacterium]|nr:PBS lyase [Pseudomonadota bacterium]MBU1710240.1 PBS lyase [Pseudomonadota bacterium]
MAKSAIKTKPWCVFCGQTIAKPRPSKNRKLGEFTEGSCQCGAVYSCDPTGFNVGAAIVECMVNACNDDWDLAWELIPETDYLTGRLENYDEITNQVIETKNLDGRKVKGVIYFIRLHKDISEIAARSQNKDYNPSSSDRKNTIPDLEPTRDPKRKKKRADKKIIQEMAAAGDIDGLVDLVFDDTKTLRFLQRILYTPDDVLRWKTAHVIGKVCARLATRQPGKVSDLLHRLFAACSDSAASSWGAIETIGSIIGERTDIFGAFTRHLLNYLDDPATLPLVLWSLGKIAKTRPDLIRSISFYPLLNHLMHPDALVRGLTLILCDRITAKEATSTIEKLTVDSSSFTYYEAGEQTETTVAALAKQALDSINRQGDKK